MIPRTRWMRKPPFGATLNPSHWFAKGAPKGLWLVNEGSGASLRDISRSNNNGSLVGSPVWGIGPMGSQIGSFTTTAYIPVDGAAAAMSAGYPFWVAAVVVNTSATTDIRVLTLGNSGTANQRIVLRLNNPINGNVGCFTRNDSNTGVDMNVAVSTTTDGLPHLVACVNASAADRRLIWDGVQVASDTTSIAAPFTFNQATLGIDRNSGGVSNEFLGSIVWAAMGQGAVPDFAALWANLWAPYQTANVRRWFAQSVAAGGKLFRPATLSLGAGGPFFETPVNG